MGCVFSNNRSPEELKKQEIKMTESRPVEKCRKHYICDICGQDGLVEDEMRSHVLIEHVEGSCSCPFCDLGGISVDEMNIHVNSEHLDVLAGEGAQLSQMDLDSPVSPTSESSMKSSSQSSAALISSPTSTTYPEGNDDHLDDIKEQHVSNNNVTINFYPSTYVPSTSFQNQDLYKKRSMLYLDVNQKLVRNNRSDSGDECHSSNDSSPEVKDVLYCPFCAWCTFSESDITKHVNIKHTDILSPMKNTTEQLSTDKENNIISSDSEHSVPSTSSSAFDCPLCGLKSENADTLELHVNMSHADLLSPFSGTHPERSQVSTPMSIDSLTDSSHMCPICGMEYADTNDLAVHVDGHFSSDNTPVTEFSSDGLIAQELEERERLESKKKEEEYFNELQDIYGMRGGNNYKKQADKNLGRALDNDQISISEYFERKHAMIESNAHGVDEGQSCTKGIIGKLHQYLKQSNSNQITGTWLCSMCDHYAASYGDKGWGCGYRNLQMLLSCLATNATYQQVLFNGRPLIPSLVKIQRLLEAAWQKGFDVQGSEQLGGKVVNTSKWIGATEIVAMLSSLNIKCQLLDFHAPTGKDGTHPRLFEWVLDYFKKEAVFKPPLYLQHQGHSRTIIGAEVLKGGNIRLLLFDPSCNKKQMQQFLGDISPNLMRSVRRTLGSMKAKQYQIVSVVGILNDQEYEENKIMKSSRIP